ncbi:MAG: cytochrome c3 family protein [bacterium]
MVGAIMLPRVQIASSDATFADNRCLPCHENVFDQLPAKSVHKPFEERKCYQCHQSQFPGLLEHSFTFPELAPDHTFAFALKGFGAENALQVSSLYSFSPRDIDINGAALSFPGSDGFPRISIVRDVRQTDILKLSWTTTGPKSCILEWGELQGSMGQTQSVHVEKLPLGVEIGITACYQCHPKNKLGISHPVNVVPSPNIREKMKTSGLPTGKNGLLLCVTCHFPHASGKESLGRKAVSEELCVACHSKEIYNPE